MNVAVELRPRISKVIGALPSAVHQALVSKFTHVGEKVFRYGRFIQAETTPLFFGRPEAAGFYTGLLPQVSKAMTELGVQVSVLDYRPRLNLPNDAVEARLVEAALVLAERTGKKPYYFQLDVARMMATVPGGTFQMCTGSGKSLAMALGLYVVDQPTIVVVHRDYLLKQMRRELRQVLNLDDVGIVGGRHNDRRKVTIAVVNTLWKKRELTKGVTHIVYDECHRSASTESRKMMLDCDAPLRHAFTATYTRSVKGELNLLYSVSGERLMQRTSSQHISEGFAPRLRVTMIRGDWSFPGISDDDDKSIVVDQCIVHNKRRNELGCRWTFEHWVRGRKGFMFVAIIKHGEILVDGLVRAGVPRDQISFVQGRDSEAVREAALRDLETGRRAICVCTPIFDEGADVPAAEFAAYMTGRKSEIACRQAAGRPRGKGLAVVHLLDFFDNAPRMLRSFSRNRLEHVYKTETSYDLRVLTPQEAFHASSHLFDVPGNPVPDLHLLQGLRPEDQLPS